MTGNNFSFEQANKFISPYNVATIESSLIVPITRKDFRMAIRDFHNYILRDKQKRTLDEINNIFIEWISISGPGLGLRRTGSMQQDYSKIAPSRLSTVMFDGDNENDGNDIIVGPASVSRGAQTDDYNVVDFYMKDMIVDDLPGRNNNQEDVLTMSKLSSMKKRANHFQHKPKTVLGINEGREYAGSNIDDLSHATRGGEKYKSRIVSAAIRRSNNY